MLDDESAPQFPINFTVTLVSPTLVTGDSEIGRGDTISVPQDWATDGSLNTDGFYVSLIRESVYNRNCGDAGGFFIVGEYTTCDVTDVDNSSPQPALPTLVPGRESQTQLVLTRNQIQSWTAGQSKIAEGGWYFKLWVNPWIEFNLPVSDGMFIGNSKWIAVRAFETAAERDAAQPLSQNNQPSLGPGTSANDYAGLGVDPIGPILSLVNSILGVVVWIVRQIVWALSNWVVLPILDITLSLDGANIASIVYVGWTYVRDFVNMFFILILIVLGFATILRIESYNYRHILVELILMAVLVNFSLVIARIIVQVADLLQFAFLSRDEGLAGLRNMYKLLTIDQVGAIQGFSWNTPRALASTATILFGFAMELMAFVTFGAVAIYMLIRVTALWILMIISPFAYALRILPSTHHYAEEWWHNFLKYAFFAPIMAFFLRMTIALHDQGLRITQGTHFASQNDGLATDIQSYFAQSSAATNVPIQATLELVIIYVIVLAFMWAGLMVANKMGVYGADMITDLAKKGIGAGTWPLRALSGAAVRYGATKYDEKTLGLASGNALQKAAYAVLHPIKFRKAMSSDAEKDREKAKHLAEAAALKVKRETPLLKRQGKDPMFHALTEQGEEELSERYGAYSGNESEEVKRTAELEAAARGGDKKAARMLIAQTFRNAKGKHINQVLAEQKEGLAYTHANLSSYFNGLQKDGVFSENVNEELQTQLSEIGYDIGDATLTELSDGGHPLEVEETELSLSGKAKEKFWNPKTGKMEERTLKEYRYKGTKQLLDAIAEVQADPTTTEANYDEKVRSLAKAKGLDDHSLQNAQRALTNIRNRNINVSKVDKFNLFHNSLFTTKFVLQADGTVKNEVVLGDGGDQAFLNIQAGDLWRAGRNGIPDKSKEWIKKMFEQSKGNAEIVKSKLEDSYRTWLAARNEYKSADDIKIEVAKKVEDFAKMAYASQFAAGVDAINGAVKQSGVVGIAPEDMTARAQYLLNSIMKGIPIVVPKT